MIATRSPVARLGILAASPLAIVAGIYLLFAGHNQPGGGFAAGLVFGAVIALRTVTGLETPLKANTLIAFGMGLICVTAMAPLFVGRELLDQGIVTTTLPILGKVKTGSALPFDIGVTAVVMGLIISLLKGLGATELARPTAPTYTAPDIVIKNEPEIDTRGRTGSGASS